MRTLVVIMTRLYRYFGATGVLVALLLFGMVFTNEAFSAPPQQSFFTRASRAVYDEIILGKSPNQIRYENRRAREMNVVRPGPFDRLFNGLYCEVILGKSPDEIRRQVQKDRVQGTVQTGPFDQFMQTLELGIVALIDGAVKGRAQKTAAEESSAPIPQSWYERLKGLGKSALYGQFPVLRPWGGEKAGAGKSKTGILPRLEHYFDFSQQMKDEASNVPLDSMETAFLSKDKTTILIVGREYVSTCSYQILTYPAARGDQVYLLERAWSNELPKRLSLHR